MTGQVKANYLSSVRSILKTVTIALAADEFEEVFQDAVDISTEKEKIVVDGIRTSTRCKPEVLVMQMHELKVNGKFYFTVSEFLTASQIRSFFSREKAKRQKLYLSEIDMDGQEDESFQDELALEEILDQEALRQICTKVSDEEEQTENTVQLTRGVKHNASQHDLSDKKRSSFKKKSV
ncbi:unnamed protein product [Rotaria sp. Silwood2]|nr:unnamed protein product [Rotaria sp. Silwood2]CAF3008308.1 unnamed protein product [Rotaria sp. Silwood2]CAF4506714.1 unnamed protein product [Rotaria sp. Silwood2]